MILKIKMDVIKDLQTDDSVVTDKERYTINMIFNKKKKGTHLKNILIASLLFLMLSLPIIDTLIEKYIKITHTYYKLGIKTLLFLLFYFVIVNYLTKN